MRIGYVFALLASAAALPASGAMITFSGLQHGEIVTNQFVSDGLTISVDNFNRSFDLGIIFDTTRTNTADPDLEDPWEMGNIATDEILGNVLILAENNVDANNNGLIDTPDDEANRPAGEFYLDFATPQTALGFDILDIEGTAQENGYVEFFAGGISLRRITFNMLVTNNNPFFDASIEFGDESANRIQPFTTAALGIGAFDRAVIRLGGSGAIDNINYVPAPGFVSLAGAASLALARRRRA